jgi:hypothetical protein
MKSLPEHTAIFLRTILLVKDHCWKVLDPIIGVACRRAGRRFADGLELQLTISEYVVHRVKASASASTTNGFCPTG